MATLDARAWYERAAHHERAWYERACLITSPASVPGFVTRAGGLVTRVRVEESWPHMPHQLRRCPWKRDLDSFRSVLAWRWRNHRRPRSATGSGRWRQPSAPCAASRSRSRCWSRMAARRAPTSAGTARTLSHARNAGPQPVRRDAHTPGRFPALPSQAPGNRRLMERRPSGWTACWSRQRPPCKQSRRSPARPCGGPRWCPALGLAWPALQPAGRGPEAARLPGGPRAGSARRRACAR